LRAVSRKEGKVVLEQVVRTAGTAVRIQLHADRTKLRADGDDLSYITVRIVDARGELVPDAGNDLQFTVEGEGTLAGADNGYQADMESFKADHHKAYNGLCLAVVRAGKKGGKITVRVSGQGLSPAVLVMASK
jgi:beta-galactosidase